MNFDLLNTSCQNAILISDDYCLDKSFDIIDKNLQRISQDLESSSFDIDKFVILKERYEKKKDLYNKFLTFTRQFSSRLISVQKTYDSYKDIWNSTSTPFEVIYPEILEVSEWGTFNKGNGILLENKTTSKKAVDNISKWINDKFPEQRYGIYKNITINVFIYTDIPNNFTFESTYNETCGMPTVGTVGCDGGYRPSLGHHGCNRMGTDGNGRPNGRHSCGNLYDWCWNSYFGIPKTTGSVTGSCKGLSTPKKTMKIKSNLECENDFYLLGYNQIKYTINKNNIWERV